MPTHQASAKGVYLHIPFCLSKCPYCDFASRPLTSASELEKYVWFLTLELEKRASGRADTVFFGGGTPSLCRPAHIEAMLEVLAKRLKLSPGAEISLEANPGTINLRKAEDFRRAGINRVSVGVQSTSDAHLRRLGRAHTAREAREIVAAIRKAGIENLSCDLMYGLPEQKLADFQKDLRTLAGWELDHLSLYALTPEEGTPLGGWVRAGQVAVPDDERVAEMYAWARAYLSGRGFEHYELSNFSKPGKACRHNIHYWRNEEYLGLGAAAHSFEAGKRSWNQPSPEVYMQQLEQTGSAVAGSETLAGRARIAETLILGLRLLRGVSWRGMDEQFSPGWRKEFEPALADMEARGLLAADRDSLRLTEEGLFLSNLVFRALV